MFYKDFDACRHVHNPRMDRRRLLLTTLGAGVLGLVPGLVQSAQGDWRQDLLNRDRFIKLKRTQSKEAIDVCYWRHGQGWDVEGYLAVCRLMRDVKYDRQHQIDPRLLDSLYIMQQWLMAYGRPHEIQVLSGYRTPEHNANLEGAAKNSMHLQGRAVDVHIPGMKTDVLSNMAKMIGVGGVGLYQDRGFIHVDTGPVRSWESKRRKKL